MQAPHAEVAGPEAPAPAAFALASLPRDLLPLILLRLPRHHRLRHASRVCKAWRALILSNTGELKVTVDRERRLDAIWSLLPALRTLSLHFVAPWKSPLHLPTALTSLRLSGHYLRDVNLVPPYPSLTHLAYEPNEPAIFFVLARASASSLRSLETRLAHLICRLRLPALTSLALQDSYEADDLAFLLAHASQLHRLSLRHLAVDFINQAALVGDLPRLTSLTCLYPVSGVWHSVLAPVALLRLRHTALRTLTVVCSHADCPPDVAALVAPVLTSLDVTADMAAPSACRSSRAWPAWRSPPRRTPPPRPPRCPPTVPPRSHTWRSHSPAAAGASRAPRWRASLASLRCRCTAPPETGRRSSPLCLLTWRCPASPPQRRGWRV